MPAGPVTTPPDEAAELRHRIDLIERGYEYLLAYAAQGRREDRGTEVRARLTDMHAALEGLEQVLAAALTHPPDLAPFLAAITEDARKAGAAIAFVLNREAISSLLVDNLNASIHLRALLTDLFLLDQGLRT
jgi:hypothetical protein